MREALLRLEGLTKRYGQIVPVDHLTLTIYRGEFFTFLGPSGAGKRVWPEDKAFKRKARSEMVIDEKYGPLVQDVFAKFGRQGWSVRAIVTWLNGQVGTYPNPDSPTGRWSIERLNRMLRNEAYVGTIVWGRSPKGYYEHYQGPVLRSGEGDCAPARHPALIDRDVWEAVMTRLEDEQHQRLRRTTRASRARRGDGYWRDGCRLRDRPVACRGDGRRHVRDGHHPQVASCPGVGVGWSRGACRAGDVPLVAHHEAGAAPRPNT